MKFIEFYNQKVKEFKEKNLFVLIEGKEEAIKWPDSTGVYAIWEKINNNKKKLIYIGLTGKFSKKNGTVSFNNANFKSRASRWTPYRFCESEKYEQTRMRYHFRYGPKESNVTKQNSIKYNLDAYSNSIPYTNLEIHCFCINSDHNSYTPALLEAELLTKYLKEKGTLPPGNNEL